MTSINAFSATPADEKLPGYAARRPSSLNLAPLDAPALDAPAAPYPPAMIALPPCWPTYDAEQWIEIQQRRPAIYLLACAVLLTVQAILLDSGTTSSFGLNRSDAYRVESAASFVAFFLLAIGLVSSTSALLQFQGLRTAPWFEANRHKPGHEIFRAIFGTDDQPSLDARCRRQALGASRLCALADFCLGSGAIALGVGTGARVVAINAPPATVVIALVVFGIAATAFFIIHGASTWVNVARGRIDPPLSECPGCNV